MNTIDNPDLQQIITMFDNSTLSELEFSSAGYTLKLKRNTASSAIAAAVPVAEAAKSAKTETKQESPASYEVITSPIVGTFYLTPAPDAPPYVRVGNTVKTGSVLCTIEAMKLMNQLEADFACEIVEVLAKPEQMVEFGQPLFKVKRV